MQFQNIDEKPVYASGHYSAISTALDKIEIEITELQILLTMFEVVN